MNHRKFPAQDTITLNVKAWLPLRERVLLLFRPIMVSALIDCEIAPGRTCAVSTVWAARWRWPWQHRGAAESAEPK